MKQELEWRLQEIFDLHSLIQLAQWDQHTYMPTKATMARGRQVAVLERLYHQRLIAPELEQLMQSLENEPTLSDVERCLLRVVRRERHRAIRIPETFVSAFSQHKIHIYRQWVKARTNDDFSMVAAALADSLNYTKEYASYFPSNGHVADPLIDEGDEGLTVASIKKLFKQLKDELVPFVQEIVAQPQVENAFLFLHYPRERQLLFIQEVLDTLGFDNERMTQDFAHHPFMTKIAHDDVRITTRIEEHDLSSGLFSSIHEMGHALYELNFDPTLEGTLLHAGASFGIHESQSRLLENMVGKSRTFWNRWYPRLQEIFPTQLGNVNQEQFYQAINRVEPSLIRTEADEVTYNLHVIIRFELELALLQGDLSIDELPTAWNEAYQHDLGLSPQSDRTGVLQDIHWYCDFLGGMFHGYTLGNILSAQFFQAAKQASLLVEDKIQHGDFTALQQWLAEHVHHHGRKFTPDQLIKQATGEVLQVQPFLAYLREKYGEIYHI